METAAKSRQTWVKSWDFIFALLGNTVGLSNVWRFPYLCFKNGGGAFLVPYVMFASALGIPVMILETSLGQRLRKGLTKSWEIVPIFKGIAFAQIMVIFHYNVSYVIILAWSLKYLINCFSATLPWANCNNTWNTDLCVSPSDLGNGSSLNLTRVAANTMVSSATEYWLHEILSISPGIEVVGSLRKDLVLYLAILWVLIYFATFKGIKWSAKVVYVTATLPFVLIAMIVVKGATLDGAQNGLYFYLVPNVTKLVQPQVWVSAATQVLYSYATACGVLTTLGSYNKYRHNFIRDSCLIGLFNSIASFASGLGVFSVIGFMAHYQNTTIDNVATSGPGLAFIVYPEALSLLPMPQFWCSIFFLTLLFLGFDSEFVSFEILMAFLYDNIPVLRRRRLLVHAAMSSFIFLLGLFMLTEGGIYVFEIYNNYGAAGWSVFFVVTCQFVAVAWIYGFDRYWSQVVDMVGAPCGRLWLKASWLFVGPVTTTIVTFYYLSNHAPLTYRDYTYPGWAQFIAHMISLTSVGMIPIYAIYRVIAALRRNEDIRQLFRPNDSDEKKLPEMEPMHDLGKSRDEAEFEVKI